MTKKFGAGLALGVIGTILVAIAAWLTVAYTGAYNVAASDQHFDAVRWTLDTTMHRSVSNRAGGAELPEVFSPELIAAGAQHYAESCAHCHGTPGGEPAGWSRGMRPEPPHLTEAASEWTSQEVHWIVSNGIKMSGMPAFASHHAPEEIVQLTAFVTALPGLTAEDYSALTASAPDQQEQPSAPDGDDPDRESDDGAGEAASE
jgi:mono/diheme cytochrome c family protein